MSGPTLLTARELAEQLGITYERVLELARRDEIPSIRDSRGRRYFNVDRVIPVLRNGVICDDDEEAQS